MELHEFCEQVKQQFDKNDKVLDKVDKKLDEHAERITRVEEQNKSLKNAIAWLFGIIGSCIAGCVLWMVKK